MSRLKNLIRGRLRLRRSDERGAIAVTVALITCGVLITVAALTVDIGNTWARRGLLQHQADLAAKFAAQELPVISTTVPVTPLDSQLKVAKAVAYYVSCNPVSGQSEMTSVPACPSTNTYLTDAGIETFAKTLLTNGRTGTNANGGTVTFPTVNRVAVTAPAAQINFGFGRVAGAEGSVQSRSATAEVLSPGSLLPVGLSLTCLANPLGTVPLGVGDTVSQVMPINYVSTGYPGQTGSGGVQNTTHTPGLTDWSDLLAAYNNSAGTMTMTSGYPTISTAGAVTVSFDWRGNRNGWTVDSIKIYLRKVGYRAGDATGQYSSAELANGLGLTAEGTTSYTLNLPPGTYEALIRFTGRNGALTQTQQWRANQYPTFIVNETGELRNLVSCARPLLSPRNGFSNGVDAGDRAALSVNVARGLDHGLAMYPGLVNVLDGLSLSSSAAVKTTLDSLAANPSFAFECLTNTNVKQDYSTRRTDGPNCVRADTTRDWSSELTQGLLTGGTATGGAFTGRLACPATGQCNFSSTRAVLSDPGGITGTFNNDSFQDFIRKDATGVSRYLNDPFFMSLDSFLHPSVPLVTPPNDTIFPELYQSPRFFWAPVVSTAYVTTGVGKAADYPILTFRPVFLTADSSTQIQTPIDMLFLRLINQSTKTLAQTLNSFGDACPTFMGLLGILAPLTGILGLTSLQQQSCEMELLKTAFTTAKYLANLTSYTGSSTVTAGGLVIDSSAKKVRAARIMTVAPGALPAVPQTYTGPTVSYLGVGPKIVRLVR